MLKQHKQKINIRLGVALSATLAALVLPIATTFAYGPSRPTFTDQKPANYVTFNSITNNPHMGDERNFVRIREAGVGNYVDSVNLLPGKEYEVWTYFHNNASETYNDKAHNYRGVALDVKMRANLPGAVKKGQTLRVLSEISASNAKPSKVWDEATISSPSRDVALRYVQGSAKVTSNGKINGLTLPGEKLFGEGANLGYDAPNGVVPGCTQYSGSVVYRFKVDYAEFEMGKNVSAHGKNNWVKSYNAQPGEKVDFRITYKNTGTVTQKNVTLKDFLPKGMSLVKGTVHLSNSLDTKGKTIGDDAVEGGVNIGTYGVQMGATLTFTAQLEPKEKLACGVNTLTNKAQVATENGGKTDEAKVTVNRDCTPQEKAEFCEVPGKGHLKKGDPQCSDNCKIKGYEHLKANDPNCAQIPTELPKTGPMEATVAIIAIMALTGMIAYWVRSREELKKATNSLGEVKPKQDQDENK